MCVGFARVWSSAGPVFREVAGDRQFVFLALMCLDHKHNPEHKTYDPEQTEDMPGGPHSAHMPHSTEPPADAKNHAEHRSDNVQATERDYGLRRVEANVWALIDKEENQPSQPAKDVAQECCGI